MQKKWLWFVAAAVIGGTCACSGGEAGKGNGVMAQESLTAGEGTGNEWAEDKPEGAEHAGGEAEEPESGNEKKSIENGETDSGAYGDFQTGTWDGLTFSNSWLNIAITFPEGSAVFSQEDMRNLVGESDEILVNSGDYEDIRSMASEALNIYDFMVTMPDGRSSVQLAYMNAEKVAPGQEISAEDCLKQLAGELSSIEDMGYELGEIEKAEIAGKEFVRFSASLMGGALYQEYYAVRAGDYVAMMTATYEAEGKEAVEALIEGIREIP